MLVIQDTLECYGARPIAFFAADSRKSADSRLGLGLHSSTRSTGCGIADRMNSLELEAGPKVSRSDVGSLSVAVLITDDRFFPLPALPERRLWIRLLRVVFVRSKDLTYLLPPSHFFLLLHYCLFAFIVTLSHGPSPFPACLPVCLVSLPCLQSSLSPPLPSPLL